MPLWFWEEDITMIAAIRNAPVTEEQLAARQALIDSMAAVSIVSPEQMADMVLTELEDRGYTIKANDDS